MNDFGKIIKLMTTLIEINAGKSIDQSIADGTLKQDVKSAHDRFKEDCKKGKSNDNSNT